MCSMPRCSSDSALEFHHIDGDPSNNDPENLLVLCSNHHATCTKGSIDANDCRHIKKHLARKEVQFRSLAISKSDLRSIVRDELQRRNESRSSTRRSSFRSPLDRRYLFHVLEKRHREFFEVYMAIRVLGALRPRGAAQQLIRTQRLLKKDVKRLGQQTYDVCYREIIQSIGNIGTQEGLKWLAGELIRQKQDTFCQFVIYKTIAASPNSKRHIGFRLADRKHLEPGESVASFRHQGKLHRYSFVIRRVDGKDVRS